MEMNVKRKFIAMIPMILIVLFLSIIILTIEHLYQPDISELYKTPTDDSFFGILSRLLPLFLGITLLIMIISFIFSIKHLKALFKKIDKKTIIGLIIIFLVGFSLRFFVAPHGHRIYFDEDIYLNIGQNIAKFGRAVFCGYGTQDKIIEYELNKEPNGLPFLMSIFFFFFGVSEDVAFATNAIIVSFTVIIIFFITYLLFENKIAAIFSSLIFALIPVAIEWSPTASTETLFTFFTSLTMFGFLSYFKSEKNIILLFSVTSLAYTIQIRPEGVLVIIIVVLMFLLLKKNLFYTIEKKGFVIIIILFSLLILPHLIHLNAVKSESWGASGEKLSFEYVPKNLDNNGKFFIENERFPLIFTILSIIGLLVTNRWREKIILIFWFLMFFLLYLFFYAGNFNYGGISVRFSVIMYPSIAILAGLGVYLITDVFRKIEKRIKKKHLSIAALFVITFLILFSFLPFLDEICKFDEEPWDARLSHDFLIEKMNNMSDDCWIVSTIPTISLLHGKRAIMMGEARKPDVISLILNESNCVYYYEDYWANFEYFKKDICKYIHETFDPVLIDSVSRGWVTYSLYKIETRRK